MPKGPGVFGRGNQALLAAAMAAQLARKRAVVTAPVRGAGRVRKARLAATRLGASVMRYRKRKQNIKRVLPVPARGGLPSFSKFVLSNKLNPVTKTIKRATEPNFWVNNFASQVVNAEGFQNAETYWFANLDHLKQMALLVPNASSTGVAPKRYLLESIVGEFMMTNSSLATQYVDIYDVVRKRDCGANTYSGTPLAAWEKGVSDQSSAPPDMTAWKNINSLPTDSKLFCDYFRVIKRTHIGLSAGATHRHSVLLRPNRIVDTALLNEANGDLKGFAVYTMVVINGQPASIPSEVGPATVTTATTALDIVWSARFKYTWLYDNTRSWVVQDNLSSLKGEQITQDGLGAFVSNTII